MGSFSPRGATRGQFALLGRLTCVALAPGALAAQQEKPSAVDTSQRDVMDILSAVLHKPARLSDTIEIERRMTVSILPSVSYNPATGFSAGLSGNAATRFGSSRNTTLSAVSVSANYTTKGQLNILLRSNAYGRGNRLKLEGDWRYLDTNQPTYGLGPAQPPDNETPMDFKLARFYETFYLEVVPNVLMGVGYHLDLHADIVDRNADDGLVTPYLRYNLGQTVTRTVSSGLSLNILSDTRDNPLNVKRGIYASGSFRVFSTFLGSDTDWQSLQGEFRVYPWLDRRGRQTLAIWTSAWLTFGHAPYLDLPATGWDYSGRMGRGYPQGRIRARDLGYAEIEYRRTITANGLIGAVAFVNFTTTSDPVSGELRPPNLGAGIGLRIKLNKQSQTNITVDVGFGAQGSRGLFGGNGEAF